MAPYDTFADAANTGAIKVVLHGSVTTSESVGACAERVVMGAGAESSWRSSPHVKIGPPVPAT